VVCLVVGSSRAWAAADRVSDKVAISLNGQVVCVFSSAMQPWYNTTGEVEDVGSTEAMEGSGLPVSLLRTRNCISFVVI